MSKKVTIGQLLEAMEANNVPLKRGNWFGHSGISDLIVDACILGQCAINLGVTEGTVSLLLNTAKPGLSSTIISWNDSSRLDYGEMVRRAKGQLKGKEDVAVDAVTTFYLSRLKVPAV